MCNRSRTNDRIVKQLSNQHNGDVYICVIWRNRLFYAIIVQDELPLKK